MLRIYYEIFLGGGLVDFKLHEKNTGLMLNGFNYLYVPCLMEQRTKGT